MATISQIRKCYSCGATLQCEDPSKPGYVKKETLENASQNFLFCDSCFEAERYHSTVNEPTISDDFLTLLEEAKKKNALIVYVINLFSFEASFSSKVFQLIEGTNLMVVANKFDLMPKNVTKENMVEYVRHRFHASGLVVDPEKIYVTSAFNEASAREIISRIYQLKNGKDVYIIGSKASGKSTLISSFLRVYSNLSKGTISTHEYKDTQLRVMEIPINKSSSMYDCPGLEINNSILYDMDRLTLKQIYLTKPVEARSISISEGQALYIGGLSFIELVSGRKTKLSCYFHNQIGLKKVDANKAEEKFVKLVSKKLLKPSYSKIKNIKDMDVFEIKITESNRRDIGIQGLGWISFESNKQVFRIYVPKGVSIYSSRTKVVVD